MTRSIFILAVGALHIVAAASLATEPTASADAKASQKPILVHEDSPDTLSDEPGLQLGMARESFLTVDLGATAKRLRKAATILRSESNQSGDVTGPPLNHSADELESLAHRVENGKVDSVQELDRPMARALHRLSRHHYLMAERSWLQKRAERTGEQLRAAVDNLEHAAQLSGQEVQAATQTVAKDVRSISARLVKGMSYGVDEVGKGFENLGKQVESVGKAMEPAPAVSARGADGRRK